MNKITFILLLLLGFATTKGQKIIVNGYIGYGQYQLSNLKSFQTDLKNSVPQLQVESVEKFPNFLNYSLGIEYSVNGNNYWGLITSYYTTGARNHLKDYSGEYKLDMILNGYKLGLQFRTVLEKRGKLDINFEMKAGIILSTLTITELFKITNVTDESVDVDFGSRTLFGEPSFRLNYLITPKLLLEMDAGYEFNLNSSIYSKENHDYNLKNRNGNIVNLNWSGVRCMVGVGYNLF